MKKRGSIILFMIALMAIGLIGYASLGYGAHSGGDVVLKSAAGVNIVGGTSVPYSPKQTCGMAAGACHNYESNPVDVQKQQTVGGTANAAYNVKVASHGVTAGYHFQQGLNVPWGQTQRDFYGVPSFTSSPGMVGKY